MAYLGVFYCYYFNQILCQIQSVIRKLGHRCHAITLLETVQVRFYHERLRMKLVKSVIQLHYKVFELLHFLEKFTPESDSQGIPQKSAQKSAQSIKHLKNVNEIQYTRKAHPQLQKVRWIMRSAECGVRSAECGKCGVWKMPSAEIFFINNL